jgi:Cu+-exporting ATPase
MKFKEIRMGDHDHDHDRGHDHHHSDEGDAICPVCEMKVHSATSPSREYEGVTYYFCNDSCARAFDQEPAEYAQAH